MEIANAGIQVSLPPAKYSKRDPEKQRSGASVSEIRGLLWIGAVCLMKSCIEDAQAGDESMEGLITEKLPEGLHHLVLQSGESQLKHSCDYDPLC